jgi:hypothetical protein
MPALEVTVQRETNIADCGSFSAATGSAQPEADETRYGQS